MRILGFGGCQEDGQERLDCGGNMWKCGNVRMWGGEVCGRRDRNCFGKNQYFRLRPWREGGTGRRERRRLLVYWWRTGLEFGKLRWWKVFARYKGREVSCTPSSVPEL